MTDTTVGIILIMIGVLTMLGAALNWRIVSHSGKLLNMLLGDSAARTIAFIVGALVFIVGIGRTATQGIGFCRARLLNYEKVRLFPRQMAAHERVLVPYEEYDEDIEN